MKKLIIGLMALCMANAAVAQNKGYTQEGAKAEKPGILNHLDIGVTAGTMGIGADLSMPIGKSVRVRAGYTYMPAFTLHSDFPIETRNGRFSDADMQKFMRKKENLEAEFAKYGIDINAPKFAWWKEKIDRFRDIDLTDQVTMDMKPSAHQFKLLVDVMPLRNKHWSFTAGLYIGNSNIGNAINNDEHAKILEGVAEYNNMYLRYCQGGIEGNYLHKANEIENDPFFKNGIAGFPLGKFENGDLAIMVPNKDYTARAEMEVSKVRPYLGFAYNTHLSRNHRWNMNVDAGIMLLCGKPKVYVDNVYRIDASKIDIKEWCFDVIRPNAEGTDMEIDAPLNGVNIMEDVQDIPGKVGDLVDFASKMKVYPNLSVTFSYRLF